jgi:hypothetical protein
MALTGLLLQVPSAGAQSTLTVTLSAEAWYRPLPLPVALPETPCLPAAGCVVPPVTLPAANPYPAKTLHVGASGGAEEARTYISLNTTALPFGVEVAGGTLVLPVLADPTAGTVAPETAVIQVCLVTAPVQDGVEGTVGGAPAADCATKSKAAFKPASGDKPAQFTADLAPFANAIAAGVSSFAIVPVVAAGDTAAWHVAFSRRDRQGGVPISAELRVAGDDEVPDLPAVDSNAGSDGSADLPALGAGSTPELSVDSPPLSAPLAPAVSSQVPAPATVPVAVAIRTKSVLSPTLLLLPLLMVAGVAWVGRAFTRDLVRGGT